MSRFKYTLLFFIFSFILYSCSSSQTFESTTTVASTTTVFYGNNCNKDDYLYYSRNFYDDYNSFLNLIPYTNLLDIDKSSLANEYLNNIKYNLSYLDLPTLNYHRSALISSIDSLIEDINYYTAYRANEYSVAQVNNSLYTFKFEFQAYFNDYSLLCSQVSLF